MAPPFKLTDEDIKRIRRRVRAGEHITDLADEYGVDRKTIRRRLDALEHAEAERAMQIAEKRLRRQAAREKRKLVEREHHAGVVPSIEAVQSRNRSSQKRKRVSE
jgi:DeoR/GlpR family transcriptional regulator of sugar metabolism